MAATVQMRVPVKVSGVRLSGARRVAVPALRNTNKPASFSATRRAVVTMGEDVRTLDFGGRDAFEGELATGFTDRPLGYADTEHQIQIPDVSKLKTNIAKLHERDFVENAGALTLDQAESLLKTPNTPICIGWSIEDFDGTLKLCRKYKTRGEDASTFVWAACVTVPHQ
mmetsp:Transcript_8691/g.32045  ORF Transcript_8691/g.32045 Transcript_8691/m.32045 type:complete len:169 (+) Transcript_8691:100-606(+)